MRETPTTKPLLEYLEAQLDQVDRRRTIGSQIRTARLSSGTSQKELAEAIGVQQPYLANVEAGRKYPSADLMTSIVYYFSQEGEVNAEDEAQD